MRCRMRLERNAVCAPALDVPPREMREPPPAVGHIPSIQSAREIRDDEACRGEPHAPQHRKRVVTKTAVRVVECDEELPLTRLPFAANARLELDERHASPARVGQRMHLPREPARRDTRDAELSTPFDLVIAEDGRDHDPVYTSQAPVLPKPPAPRELCSSSVASTSSGVS